MTAAKKTEVMARKMETAAYIGPPDMSFITVIDRRPPTLKMSSIASSRPTVLERLSPSRNQTAIWAAIISS